MDVGELINRLMEYPREYKVMLMEEVEIDVWESVPVSGQFRVNSFNKEIVIESEEQENDRRRTDR